MARCLDTQCFPRGFEPKTGGRQCAGRDVLSGGKTAHEKRLAILSCYAGVRRTSLRNVCKRFASPQPCSDSDETLPNPTLEQALIRMEVSWCFPSKRRRRRNGVQG